MTDLLFTCGAAVLICLFGPKFICFIRGHRYNDIKVLWRTCTCCKKTQYYQISTGKYID